MNKETKSLCILKKDFSKYPFLTRLLELHQIPEQLYIRGEIPHITFDDHGRATPRILTVVGSRAHTTYGRQVTEQLIKALAGEPVIIISGLALGIDGVAHTSALNNNLTTLAIPGSGLGDAVIYPKIHYHLKEKILASGGALLSELKDETQAAPWTFPQRNRIMAALADAILVIEAEEKSGTLITARLALELGRDIGAVPGQIFSSTSSGTNMLIREGAHPVTGREDLFDLLHLTQHNSLERSETRTPHEKIILALLHEPRTKDELLHHSKLSFEDFMVAFSLLEIEGLIEESLGEVRSIV